MKHQMDEEFFKEFFGFLRTTFPITDAGNVCKHKGDLARKLTRINVSNCLFKLVASDSEKISSP